MNNLKRYRNALKLVNDINAILPIIHLTFEKLSKYKHYGAISETLFALDNAKRTMEFHKVIQIEIINQKGQE